MPPRIVRLPNHIEWDFVSLEAIEEVTGSVDVAAPIDVDHDSRRRAGGGGGARMNAVNAGFQQIGELGPMVGQASVRPEHAGGHLVANLHHVRENAGRAKSGDTVARPRKDGFDHLRMRSEEHTSELQSPMY